MANLYVADDGTIHDRDIGNCQRIVNDDNMAQISSYTTPEISGGRKFLFWLITMILSVGIGYLIYSSIGIHVFESYFHSDDLLGNIINLFCMIAPYLIVAGAVICAIIYGVNCAEKHRYNLGTYFLSALSATGGSVGAGVAMFLLAFIITILFYLLVIALFIGIIAAFLGGD